jgi:ABC-2 type transport system ATP-binding protein
MDSHSNGGGPIVAADGVRVQFGPLRAVNDVSFSLNGGDLLGLIGPNGAGKTTLLRSLAGIQPVTGGAVRVLGHNLEKRHDEALRNLGFTPDTPVFYENLTVREFLRFVAMGYGLGEAEADERIAFWLEKVWLSEKAGQKIKALSRGMRQRVGLARTLLPNPAVVLLDEPAAGLDPAGRVQFRQLMSDLREQGKAIVISSHILADMEEYCTHIGIMARGAMVKYGTVAHVAAHGEGDGRCRYTIVLATSAPGIEKVLAGLDGVTGVQADRDRLTFEFASAREQAAALLADLVGRKVPVASFVPHTPGLEEAYLRIGIEQVD